MRGYYWKASKGNWFWRKNQQTNDWEGPYNSRKAARDARAEYYDRIAKLNPQVVIVI